ncbi:MAG: Hsp20/alpha crystallin family protein [Lachnospiraceae bacterium]|jgi:HSP20 family protein
MLVPSILGESLLDDMMDDMDELDRIANEEEREENKMNRRVFGRHGRNLMKTDVRETDHSYELEMDLPGFSKDEVTISLENGNLTIHAEKSSDNKDKADEAEKNGRYIRRERFMGACERTFYVGEDVKNSDIHAKFEHGILKISIPKMDQKKIESQNTIAIE